MTSNMEMNIVMIFI